MSRNLDMFRRLIRVEEIGLEGDPGRCFRFVTIPDDGAQKLTLLPAEIEGLIEWWNERKAQAPDWETPPDGDDEEGGTTAPAGR